MQIIRTTHQPTIGTWTPFHRVTPLHELLGSAFHLASAGSQSSGGETRWSPALDVHEDDNALVVELEAAGMKKDDFDISLHEGCLTVSGERKTENEEPGSDTSRSERFFGPFSRSVKIPTTVKTDSVEAIYADGILRISLPKAEEAKPRQIEIQVK